MSPEQYPASTETAGSKDRSNWKRDVRSGSLRLAGLDAPRGAFNWCRELDLGTNIVFKAIRGKAKRIRRDNGHLFFTESRSR